MLNGFPGLSTLALVAAVIAAAPLQSDRPRPSARPAPAPARDAPDTVAAEEPLEPAPPEPAPPADVDPLRDIERRLGVDRGVATVRDVVYAVVRGPDGAELPLEMDVAFPIEDSAMGAAPLPVVLYFHGGGWQSGDRRAGAPFLPVFARSGYFAASVSYRLSGTAPYPAAVHDAKAAVRFLRAHADDLGIDPNRIGAWGHSAGGHLAALLATSGNSARLEGEVGERAASSAIQCAVTVSGPADLTDLQSGAGDGGGMIAAWLAAPNAASLIARAQEASPVTYADAADPPILVIHGTADTLVPVEQAQAFARVLAVAGVEHELFVVDGAGHGIRSPEAYQRVAEFLDARLGGRAAGAIGSLTGRGGAPR
jgi:acetyl esterase/lipase